MKILACLVHKAPFYFNSQIIFFMLSMIMSAPMSIFDFRVYFFVYYIKNAQATHQNTKIPQITLYLSLLIKKNDVVLCVFMVQIPNSKILEICPPDFHVSRAWKWKGAGANNFPPFLGMYLTPPATQNIKKYFWGAPRIF